MASHFDAWHIALIRFSHACITALVFGSLRDLRYLLPRRSPRMPKDSGGSQGRT